MIQPKISIIVPIYKVEKYIERCARSIFEQTYENLEIIFVNDCTPDNSIEILHNVLSEYPNRQKQTTIINLEKNLGVASVRNTGIKNSTGKYSIQFDSDDYVKNTMVEEMVILAELENADITVCDFMYIHTRHSTHVHVNPSLDPHTMLQQVLTGEVHSSLCNKLIKHRLYFDNNIFPIEGLNMREDLSIMFRLLYFAKKIAYIPKPFYNYVQTNTTSYTSTTMSLTHQKNAIELIRLIQFFFDTNTDTEKFQQAFRYFKADIICIIALHGDLKYYKQEALLFKDVSVKDVMHKPVSSINHKIAGIALLTHINIVVCVLRFCRYIKNRCLMTSS